MKVYKEENCPICLETFNDEFIPLQPCNHYVHKECVDKWGKQICPMCRTPLIQEEEKEKVYDIPMAIDYDKKYLEYLCYIFSFIIHLCSFYNPYIIHIFWFLLVFVIRKYSLL